MKFLISLALVCCIAIPAQAQQIGWIGVSVDDGKDQGAEIRSVEGDSPAAKAGLKTGDLIIEYNKTPVLGTVQFTRLVRETPVGRTVEIKVRRDGRDQTMQITTERLNTNINRLFRSNGGSYSAVIPDASILRDRLDSLYRERPRIQLWSSYTRSGIRVDEMTAQLRTFFGVNSNNGVLVASVETGSSADKAGLKAGDVIISVDNQIVRTPSEFDREMRSGGTKVSLRVVRDRKEIDISLDRSADSR